jgi:osmotically inducible protein OsmC
MNARFKNISKRAKPHVAAEVRRITAAKNSSGMIPMNFRSPTERRIVTKESRFVIGLKNWKQHESEREQMKEIKRQSHVHWAGDLRNGKGQITTQSKALDGAFYSVPSRFENGTETNPEELIAAAHAACFSMMLAKIIGGQKQSLEQINTNATVVLRFEDGGAKVTEVHLRTEAKVTGMSAEAFKSAAEQAKQTCPISVLLSPGLEKMTLEAELV